MAKRFIDTDLFKKKFFRKLSEPYKLFFIYLFLDCNYAGIWIVDFEILNVYLNEISENDAIEILNDKIIIYDNGEKWFLPSFIEFQYGELNPKNRAHNSVLKTLEKENLIKHIKPLISPLYGAKEKEKDKDKEKDKEKEKEKDAEFEKFWNLYDKKIGNKTKIMKKWQKLPLKEQNAIFDYLPKYLAATPDKQFRKNPETFLNNKSWNDEIIDTTKKKIDIPLRQVPDYKPPEKEIQEKTELTEKEKTNLLDLINQTKNKLSHGE